MYFNDTLFIPIAHCSWGPWKPTGPKCPIGDPKNPDKCGKNATRQWERSIEVEASLSPCPGDSCYGESKKTEICPYTACGKIYYKM